MNQRKMEKLLRRKAWVSISQPSNSYDRVHETLDQEAVHSFSLSRSVKLRRTVDSMYHDVEAQSIVMARAKEVQAKLSSSYPSLIKVMLPSHVVRGFWLGLPKGFCDSYLPKQDSAMVLQDESGTEYQTKYLSEKIGLSAGWRGFSISHKLLPGDVVVFHLVMANKFVVYIVRSNAVAEVDGALGLECDARPLYGEENIPHIKEEQMTLDNENIKETNIVFVKEKDDDNPVYLATDFRKEHLDTEMMPMLEEFENNRSFGSNSRNEIRLSDATPDFEKVKSLNDFSISVNGLIIDSEFSSYVRTKYFELCCSQNSFLHDHILEGLNYKLVSGVISETINIADAIRACKITTSQEHLTTWDKTLMAFEGLGMNVGFLRARIYELQTLSSKPLKKREAELKRDSIQEEIHMLMGKIMEIRATMKELEAEIHSLNTDIENMETLFKEIASAPW